MVARLEAQTREITAKMIEADKRGDRSTWLKLKEAWIKVMKLRLG